MTAIIRALEETQRELEQARKELERARGANREHVNELTFADTQRLHEWLAQPNGGLIVGQDRNRVVFEAVGHGGIFVRTMRIDQFSEATS